MGDRLATLLPGLVLLALVAISAQAQAAIDSAGVMDDILSRYHTAASAWQTVITQRASWLFWLLVIISMVWTFAPISVNSSRNSSASRFSPASSGGCSSMARHLLLQSSPRLSKSALKQAACAGWGRLPASWISGLKSFIKQWMSPTSECLFIALQG